MQPILFVGLPPIQQKFFLNRTQEPIVSIVCELSGVTLRDIASSWRIRKLSDARLLLTHFLRKYTRLSLKDIGKLQGDRHYSTICNHKYSFEDLYTTNKKFKKLADLIEKSILESKQI